MNPRLFAGKEEQSELAVSDDGGRHGTTVSERYLMPPVAGLVAWAVTGESYNTGIKLGGAALALAGVALAQFAGARRDPGGRAWRQWIEAATEQDALPVTSCNARWRE
jgi:hypothetical protein